MRFTTQNIIIVRQPGYPFAFRKERVFFREDAEPDNFDDEPYPVLTKFLTSDFDSETGALLLPKADLCELMARSVFAFPLSTQEHEKNDEPESFP